MKLSIIWSGVLVCVVMFVAGCSQHDMPVARDWSSPVKLTESQDALVGGVILYQWHNTIIALQVRYSNETKSYTPKCFLLDRSKNAWTETPFTGVPDGYVGVYPDLYRATVAIDMASDRVFFEQGYMENDQLMMNVLLGRMTGSMAMRDVVEKKWHTDKKALFGETGSNVWLNVPERGGRTWLDLGLGLISGADLHIPYCLHGYTETPHVYEYGPFNNGVFHSADSGMTWQLERISDFDAWLPSICTTKAYCYYLAVKNYQRDLWFSRKQIKDGSWTAPEALAETFCNSALYWKFIAAAEGDTVHVCWLDRRLEKNRLDIGLMPPHLFNKLENYAVAYCHRKDSDAGWSKNVILSKGLLYSYAPVMSVEGDKIVVAWSGVQTAPDWHKEHAPNDVYYVTSNDSGKTWTKPLKLTGGAKDGITSGAPTVMLLNGVIHLFYIQGSMNLRELSPGLTKLNQPPWPIYYQQRPFPNYGGYGG